MAFRTPPGRAGWPGRFPSRFSVLTARPGSSVLSMSPPSDRAWEGTMGVTPLTGTTVLTGTSAKHDVQGNVTITAPGLSGVAELTHGVPLDTAGAKVFEHSLGNSG